MRPVPAALYTRDILRLAVAIPHEGRLDASDGTAERRSPVCGSGVAVDVRLDDEGRVHTLGQTVHACALGQASAALMGAAAVGLSLAELEAARDALAEYLGGEGASLPEWPGIAVLAPARDYPARHAAILLPFEAVAAAMASALKARAGHVAQAGG
jgi:NifU-like protein involved in Fe-S cluster formation